MKKLLSSLLLGCSLMGSLTASAQTMSCNPDLTATVSSINSLNYTFNNETVLGSGNSANVIFHLSIDKQNGTAWNYQQAPVIGGAGTSISHTFSSSGYYRAILYMADSLSLTTYCTNRDTVYLNVTSDINGFIIPADTMQSYPILSYKVWLIQYNQGSTSLSAVDSQTITTITNSGLAHFSFVGKPAGDYLVKAKELSNYQLNNGNYMVPTYHYSSIYWSSAQTVAYNTITNTVVPIMMLSANAPSTGPGFIAGNVYQGANRTATPTAVGDPVEGMNVFLKDAAGQVIKFTTTDALGYFQFADLPNGSYTVFPEEMGLITLPGSVQIAAGNTSFPSLIFDKNSTEVKYRTTGIHSITVDVATIYPNPIKNTLYIQWKEKPADCRVQILNLLGQELITMESAVSEINLKSMPSGTYLLRINTDKGSQTLRFSKL